MLEGAGVEIEAADDGETRVVLVLRSSSGEQRVPMPLEHGVSIGRALYCAAADAIYQRTEAEKRGG